MIRFNTEIVYFLNPSHASEHTDNLTTHQSQLKFH